MKHSFTDIHHHLIYGVDDGPKDIRQTARMLHRAAEQGIGRIIATPHVTPGVVRCPMEEYQEKVFEINQLCARLQLDIRVDLGAELLYTQQTARFLDEERVPTLAGSDRVLVEFSPDVRFERFREALDSLLGSGFLPIVAHVERYMCLSQHPSRAEKIKQELDVCYQVNCSSIIGNKKSSMASHRFVEKLLDWDLIDAIGSDAHSPNMRAVHMKEAWQVLKKEFGASYANELTDGHLLFNIPRN